MKIMNNWFNRLVVFASLVMLSITFSLSAVSAGSVEVEEKTSPIDVLTGEAAEKYLIAVEENKVYNELSSSTKLVRVDSDGHEARVQLAKLSANDIFGEGVIIVESKVDNIKEHTGIVALVDEYTLEVYSVSTITEFENYFGSIVITEHDGESGEILLQNIVDETGEIIESNIQDESNTQDYNIPKGSFWWNVICNLATNGSCSLGCLAFVANPFGYGACVYLCGSFASGLAC